MHITLIDSSIIAFSCNVNKPKVSVYANLIKGLDLK